MEKLKGSDKFIGSDDFKIKPGSEKSNFQLVMLAI
jgi:hypothetical protein